MVLVPKVIKVYFINNNSLSFCIRKNIIFVGKVRNFPQMQDNDGKYIFGVVKVGDKGQIVIPRDARKVYDIKPGDALLLLGDQKGMALVKTEIFQNAIDRVMEDLPK